MKVLLGFLLSPVQYSIVLGQVSKLDASATCHPKDKDSCGHAQFSSSIASSNILRIHSHEYNYVLTIVCVCACGHTCACMCICVCACVCVYVRVSACAYVCSAMNGYFFLPKAGCYMYVAHVNVHSIIELDFAPILCIWRAYNQSGSR